MDQKHQGARERLLRSRDELLRRRGDHREGESELLEVREIDPGDVAAAEGGAIPLDSLNESEQGQVAEIEAALGRLADGTYGVCEGCDEPLEAARLEAVPSARRCFACETEHEKEHRRALMV
jgi:RNA polymerase-binding transcription factor DksA